MIDRQDWKKHRKLNWWRYQKYSISFEDKEYVCRIGHVELKRAKTADEARRFCGLHAGVIE